MGAFQGGLTFRQYYVNDPLPDGWKDSFHRGILEHAAKPIDPATEVERGIGWCSAHFALDTELETTHYDYGEYLVLALRIDTLQVPGPVLKLHTEAEVRRVLAEQKRDTLNRYERAEVKEMVKRQLRKKILPTIKTVDVVWSWMQGVVRFFSGNEKVNLEFMDLFEQTFGLLLVPESAYTRALHGGLSLTDAQKEALLDLEAEAFVDPDTQFAAMKGEV